MRVVIVGGRPGRRLGRGDFEQLRVRWGDHPYR